MTAISFEPDRHWIIDTCSVIEVRRAVEGSKQRGVYQKLTGVVTRQRMVFPSEVLGELRDGSSKQTKHQDLPLIWAEGNATLACRHGPPLAEVSEVVMPRVGAVLDVHKTSKVDEADPYVIGLALLLQKQGYPVTVITEDRRDKPTKMSVSTACGLLGLPSVPIAPFLVASGYWKRP